MPKVSVEAFLSVPPCSGGLALRALLRRLQEEFGDRVEVTVHSGRNERWEEQKINVAPGLVVGDLVKFVGVAPDYECLVSALHEAGLE